MKINYLLKKNNLKRNGQSLIEIILVMGLASIILPAIFLGFNTTRGGKAQQDQRNQAINILNETEEAVRQVREKGWVAFAVDGTYYPTLAPDNSWTLTSGITTIDGFTQSVVISSVERDSSGTIVASGGTSDNSTKRVDITISWNEPITKSVSTTKYLTRYDNFTKDYTTYNDFNTGSVQFNTTVQNVSGGEVRLADNTKAKWCSPEFSSATIDLPDGPPVAVSATASASTTSPNDVFVVTAPYATSSVKLAYIKVTANTDPPSSTLQGKFTLDAAQYSQPSYVPSGVGLDNSFKTNDVRYYTSSTNKLYALIATDKPDREVIAILINDNNSSNDNDTTGEFADPVNKIYKYHTFFNTRIYQANASSTPNQDQAPYGYGATSLTVSGNRGYISSGGYLYVFDLSTIDSKSTSTGLDMFGCRIQLDGYDCTPGSPGTAAKYGSGQTGASWSDTTAPIHNDCSDGGNIELYATNDIYPVTVGSNQYVFVAIGGVTVPEFGIVNASTVPSAARSDDTSCGRISGGDATWRRISTYDFNSNSNTEEAANSVYAKSDGTRAYISSNGGIDGDGNGQGDSKQFYILNTTNKSAPTFLSGSPSSGPSSGYYQGTGANGEMFPRRSLTVLNGQRVVLVGKDGTANGNDAQEYQVLDSGTEATPTYCGGVDFDEGFNDLTSVSEADSDNFVYMIANNTVNELKIIQGGPDGTYLDQGTYESPIFDASYSTAFNNYSVGQTIPTNTALQYQFAVANAVSGSCAGATFNFLGPDGTAGTYYTATTSAVFIGTNGSYVNPARCMRFKAYFTTTDFNTTPLLNDISVNYSP